MISLLGLVDTASIIQKTLTEDGYGSNTTTESTVISAWKCRKTIQKSKVPFITTSVNLSGEKPATHLDEISKQIKNQVDYVIQSQSESLLSGKPSKLIIDGKVVERE